MGKGDKKSKKGKRFQHSFGKTRTRKKGKTISSRKKVEVKTKPVEQKKPFKPEPEFVKPAVVEPKVEEITIKEPEITEIKEEVELPEVIAEAITEVKPEPARIETKIEEPIRETSKVEMKVEEKSAQESPKKRGRPKKKKEE